MENIIAVCSLSCKYITKYDLNISRFFCHISRLLLLSKGPKPNFNHINWKNPIIFCSQLLNAANFQWNIFSCDDSSHWLVSHTFFPSFIRKIIVILAISLQFIKKVSGITNWRTFWPCNWEKRPPKDLRPAVTKCHNRNLFRCYKIFFWPRLKCKGYWSRLKSSPVIHHCSWQSIGW